jgi:hypothetical protein
LEQEQAHTTFFDFLCNVFIMGWFWADAPIVPKHLSSHPVHSSDAVPPVSYGIAMTYCFLMYCS